MLKRLSEAISQSNIKGSSTASATHCSHHSSCNFHPVEEIELSGRLIRGFVLAGPRNGGTSY